MENDLNFQAIEEEFDFLGKWKMTSNLRQMEDNLNLSGKGRLPQFFRQMEDDLNSWAMEYNLNL
jgi:hypothetical protein